MNYQIGQTYPLDRQRRVFGDEIDPCWFIMTTPPQKEPAAKAWLERNGALEVWYPTVEAWRKMPRGRRKQVPYQKLVAPRYAFMHVDRQPQWDVLFEGARGRVSGVVGYHETPLVIKESVIAGMALVPENIEKQRQEHEAERQAYLASLRPQAGGRAELTVGPFSGYIVDVTRIHAGIAHFVIGSIPGTAAVETLERRD